MFRNIRDRIIIFIRDIKLLGKDYFIVKFFYYKTPIRWRKVFITSLKIILIIILPFVLSALYSQEWTGFGELDVGEGIQPKKLLWDWMELLVIPVLLAGTVFILNKNERRNEQNIALDKERGEMLRDYFDKMEGLFIDSEMIEAQDLSNLPPIMENISDLNLDDKWLNNDEDYKEYAQKNEIRPQVRVARYLADRASIVGRARTLTVLENLDGHRKGLLIRFLIEIGFISKDEGVIKMRDADLTGMVLEHVSLDGINFDGTNLDNAKLQETRFTDCKLSGASMRYTDLRRARLKDSCFDYVWFNSSNMYYASLSHSTFGGAHFEKARMANVWLEKAHLVGSTFKNSILRKANLNGAIMDRCKIINSNLKKANLSNASLVEVDFTGSNLRGADLTDADLTGAIISNKQLRQAKSTEGAILKDRLERIGSPQKDSM